MQKEVKSLLVIACPKQSDKYYGKYFDQIVEFINTMVNSVWGNDDIIVLADKATAKLIESKLPESTLLVGEVHDVWLRDYSPVFPSNPLTLVYQPSYLESYISTYLQDWVKKIMKNNKLTSKQLKKKLVIDGGNFVDNGKDQVIVTNKVFEDNPKLTREELAEILLTELGITHLTVIPYDKSDKTGHADGLVAFIDEKTVIMSDFMKYPDITKKVLEELTKQLKPGTNIVPIPTETSEDVYDGFCSAFGLYVNCVRTSRFLYVPTFGVPYDEIAISLIKEALNGTKLVIPIDSRRVCKLGGSVRCLTWQLEGENAEKLLSEVSKKK